MTSLKHIADSLGVSVATVSWALSGRGKERGFNEDTIKRVQEKAQEMNYRPNMIAKSLAKGSTNTIGLIVPSIDDTFYAQIAKGIELEALNNGYMLTYCSSTGVKDSEPGLINMLMSKQVDGMIIAPTKISDRGIKQLIKNQFPFVLIDRYYPNLDVNYIMVNNKEASCSLVSHLVARGSKKIAILSSDTNLFAIKYRLEGYIDALSESAIEVNNNLIIEVDRTNYNRDIIYKLDQLFEKESDIDGFYFTTHYLALEAIRYFTLKGLDYNNIYNMACFHDTQGLDILAPRMSFAMMPISKIAKEAIAILIDNIKSDNQPTKKIVLETDLVLR